MDKNSLKKITKPLAPNTCALSGKPLKVKTEVGIRVIFADAWATSNEAARSGKIYSGAALDKAAKAEAKKLAKKAEKILADAEKAAEELKADAAAIEANEKIYAAAEKKAKAEKAEAKKQAELAELDELEAKKAAEEEKDGE